jgi:cation transport regulator ChaC
MAGTAPSLTAHARQRMAQRGLSREDVLYVFDHGQRLHAAGAQHRVLRRIDIPTSDTRTMSRLNGVVVTLDRTGATVLTVYRNLHAPKHLRRKPKWGWNTERAKA